MDLKFETVPAESVELVASAKKLFLEYAISLDFNLCFQGFEEELARLPGEYSPPSGRLILAYDDGKLAGCVALRRIDDSVCEMKRLYLRPEFRGKGIGRKLADEIVEAAREIGYTKMRLDTVPSMKTAISLYRSLGFVKIGPYRANPVPGATFMEMDICIRTKI